MDEELLNHILGAAAICIKRLEFGEAHEYFADVIKRINTNEKIYCLIHKEYLKTGFIHYSRLNDMDGLRGLLTKKRSTKDNDPDIDYLIANIFQEICSRDTDLNSLRSAAEPLEKIYNATSELVKPMMANSLGLAYRRIGERKDMEFLKKALQIFNEGIEVNKDNKSIEIQIKDNKAITLIRMFEFTKTEQYLDDAEALLDFCLTELKFIHDPRDYMIKPRVLNNMGNIFKQRVMFLGDYGCAPQALSYYDEALEIWTEKNYSYEWGLVKKNIGETKYALARITGDSLLLIEAIEDCVFALKYRDLKNSPYQWGKSVEIILLAVKELKRLNAIITIKPKLKQKVIGYAEIIKTFPHKWDPDVFKNIFGNAQIAFEYLTQNK